MATQILPNSSNLINQSIQNNSQSKPQTPVEGKNATTNGKIETKDTFTPQNIKKNKKDIIGKILNFAGSTALLVGFFFIPDIISLLRNRNAFKPSAFKKLEKIKPIIESNETTRTSTSVLKNGNVKAKVETTTDTGTLEEILVMTPKGDVKKRILIKKIKSNGKFIVKNMRSYEGKGIENNAELEANAEKYLVKEYKRVNKGYGEHHIIVKRAGKSEENTKLYCANDGDPILSFKETPNEKIQTKYLYAQNRLIGTDKKITAKDGSKERNVYTMPEMDIVNKEYDPATYKPYPKLFLEKLNKNI